MPNIFQKMKQISNDINTVLNDAVDRDLTDPTVKKSIIDDMVHLLTDAGVPNTPALSIQVETDILKVLFDGALVAEKKEAVQALIPSVMAAVEDFLAKN